MLVDLKQRVPFQPELFTLQSYRFSSSACSQTWIPLSNGKKIMFQNLTRLT